MEAADEPRSIFKREHFWISHRKLAKYTFEQMQVYMMSLLLETRNIQTRDRITDLHAAKLVSMTKKKKEIVPQSQNRLQ